MRSAVRVLTQPIHGSCEQSHISGVHLTGIGHEVAYLKGCHAIKKKKKKVKVHTVTSLLGRNEEEAPVTTAAPYAIDSMLTQSQNTY
jgi:hypothetical protein